MERFSVVDRFLLENWNSLRKKQYFCHTNCCVKDEWTFVFFTIYQKFARFSIKKPENKILLYGIHLNLNSLLQNNPNNNFMPASAVFFWLYFVDRNNELHKLWNSKTVNYTQELLASSTEWETNTKPDRRMKFDADCLFIVNGRDREEIWPFRFEIICNVWLWSKSFSGFIHYFVNLQFKCGIRLNVISMSLPVCMKS